MNTENNVYGKDRLLISITVQDLQYEALEKIGRLLDEGEIDIAKKMLEFGIYTGLSPVYNAIFSEIKNNGFNKEIEPF